MGEPMNDRQLLKRKAESLNEAEAAQVLEYIDALEARREPQVKADAADDELLRTLSEAIENRRARVVIEWDRIRRRADHRALMMTATKRPA